MNRERASDNQNGDQANQANGLAGTWPLAHQHGGRTTDHNGGRRKGPTDCVNPNFLEHLKHRTVSGTPKGGALPWHRKPGGTKSVGRQRQTPCMNMLVRPRLFFCLFGRLMFYLIFPLHQCCML